MQVELEKYECGVEWLRELLYCVQFTAERVKIVGQKMANDVSRMKRKGPQVVRTVSRDMNFNRGVLMKGEQTHPGL